MGTLSFDRRLVCDFAIIIIVWCTSILLINPIGDFPLGDDWAFAATVAHLFDAGKYDPVRWGHMTLVTNVFWGALFCLPAGFSFTALRISTLVAALLGVMGAYVLLRDSTHAPRTAMHLVLILGFNPLYFALSHSFMTDTLFTALLIWAGVFFSRSLRTGSGVQLVIGTALAIAATLSRQLALCLPVAFTLVSLLKAPRTARLLLRALLPTFACLTAYLSVYMTWMMGFGAEQAVAHSLSDPHQFIRTILRNTFLIVTHAGLFLLPVLVLAIWKQWQCRSKHVIFLGIVSITIVTTLVLARLQSGDDIILPFFDNWLVASGVGDTNLRDYYFLKLDNMRPLPASFWLTVTALSWSGAVLLITTMSLYTLKIISVFRSRESFSRSELASVLASLTSALYFFLLLPSPALFDRYVVPMIPFLFTSIVSMPKQPSETSSGTPFAARLIIYSLVCAFTVFTVAATRDFLTWNRVRWTAVRDLMRDGSVRAQDIDGGFEFNGWYLFTSVEDATRALSNPEKSWWWVHRDTYLISFGPVRGYRAVREYTYQHWLPWHVQTVVVLKKQ